MRYVRRFLIHFGNALFVILLLFPAAICCAQENSVRFREFDNWEAVLTAAKLEQKPIFVDFFTTWCGPCKRLEKEVYTNSEVAEYFNNNYIPVKIQMDQTYKDNEQVKKWYNEVKMLENQYKINAYPALLFITGNDVLLNRHDGFISATDLINIGISSAKPGHKYVNPGAKYYDAILSYNTGKLNGKIIVKTANQLVNDEEIYFPGKEKVIDTLNSTGMGYLHTQSSRALYNEDALELIGRVGLKCEDPLLKIFYPNASKADKIVGKFGFGDLMVDRSIKMVYTKGRIDVDSTYLQVKNEFNEKFALRAMRAAEAINYFIKEDRVNTTKSHLAFIEDYGSLAYVNIAEKLFGGSQLKQNNIFKMAAIYVNTLCYEFAFQSHDIDQVERGAAIMKPIVDEAEKKQSWWFSQHADTYANLLYKSGKVDDAVAMQKKAIKFAIQRNEPHDQIESYQLTLDRMLSGMPTWN